VTVSTQENEETTDYESINCPIPLNWITANDCSNVENISVLVWVLIVLIFLQTLVIIWCITQKFLYEKKMSVQKITRNHENEICTSKIQKRESYCNSSENIYSELKCNADDHYYRTMKGHDVYYVQPNTTSKDIADGNLDADYCRMYVNK
jgi:hypothetical protein